LHIVGFGPSKSNPPTPVRKLRKLRKLRKVPLALWQVIDLAVPALALRWGILPTFINNAENLLGFSMQSRDHDKEKHSNGEPPLPAVSSNTLARCFGVSPKIIYDLAKAGVIERSSARLFPLEDSVRRYCEYLRSQAGNST